MPRYSKADLQVIAQFLPIFEQEGFEFVESVSPFESTPGEFTFPAISYHPQVYQLLDVLYEQGWVYSGPDFDWPEWVQTDEARRLRDDPEVLGQATAQQLAKLLTVFARQERFCDGSMQDFYESGLLSGILRRAAVLAGVGLPRLCVLSVTPPSVP